MLSFIPLNKPSVTALELAALARASLGEVPPHLRESWVRAFFRSTFGLPGLLLTTSCTHALELAALLLGLGPGDEVLLPSFTFPSTANAFVLRGARPVFCEIQADTLNLDPADAAKRLTPRTRAIVPVHYGGVPCDMDGIAALARDRSLAVVEDAAQAVGSFYRGQSAGTLSDASCFSFHETKNIVMGEGGGLCVRDPALRRRAEVLREKGTDRAAFLRGERDRYTWQDAGSSYVPAKPLTALLCAQLSRLTEIQSRRMRIWQFYHESFRALEAGERLRRPIIPPYAVHNAHIYYILLPTEEKRDRCLAFLRERGVGAASHFEPLHASPFGRQFTDGGRDPLPQTTNLAARLLRLPLWPDMGEEDIRRVAEGVRDFAARL